MAAVAAVMMMMMVTVGAAGPGPHSSFLFAGGDCCRRPRQRLDLAYAGISLIY
jgi:hypothetical protein